MANKNNEERKYSKKEIETLIIDRSYGEQSKYNNMKFWDKIKYRRHQKKMLRETYKKMFMTNGIINLGKETSYDFIQMLIESDYDLK